MQHYSFTSNAFISIFIGFAVAKIKNLPPHDVNYVIVEQAAPVVDDGCTAGRMLLVALPKGAPGDVHLPSGEVYNLVPLWVPMQNSVYACDFPVSGLMQRV